MKTDAGADYTLKFDMRSRDEKFNSHDETVIVEWRGKKIGHYRASARNKWTTHTIQLDGSGGFDRLVFREVDGGGDGSGPLLDNISLQGRH